MARTSTRLRRRTPSGTAAPVGVASALSAAIAQAYPTNVSGGAAIDPAVLRRIGYIVVTDYRANGSGILGAGTGPYCGAPGVDCWLGLEKAKNDSGVARKALWFPSATYDISKCLRFFTYKTRTSDGPIIWHMAFGATYPYRPIIRCFSGAGQFDNPAQPMPVVAYRTYQPALTSLTAAPWRTPKDLGIEDNVNPYQDTPTGLYRPREGDGTYVQSGTTITVDAGASQDHFVSVGKTVVLTFQTGGATNGAYAVAIVVSPTAFSVVASVGASRTGTCVWYVVGDYLSSYFDQQTNVGFQHTWHNIDIDTNNKAGADGMIFAGAQGMFLGFSKINMGTSPGVGLYGGGGRSSPCTAVEIVGGRIAYSSQLPSAVGDTFQAVLVGFKASGQTEQVFVAADEIPLMVVGFDISTAVGVPVLRTIASGTRTGSNCAALVDGIIRTAGTLPIDNTVGNTIYLGNVYVTGSASLAKTLGVTTAGAGTWSRIVHYAANDLSGTGAPAAGSSDNLHKYILDGVVGSTLSLPLVSVLTNQAAPPDLVGRHLVLPPMPDHGPFIDSGSTGYADPTGATDSLAGLAAAIAAADNATYDGRVFIRKGLHRISGTLALRANTKLMGIGMVDDPARYSVAGYHSVIKPLSSWVPAVDEFVVRSADSALARTSLGFIAIAATDNLSWTNRFGCLDWRAGKNSHIYGFDVAKDFTNETAVYGRPPIIGIRVRGNGGGRIYGLEQNGRGFTGALTRALHATANTQPMWLYGPQTEIAKGGTIPIANIHLEGCRAGVRIYGGKREGTAPTLLITACDNVAHYGSGGMREAYPAPYLTVEGVSTNILMACETVQSFGQTYYPAPPTHYTLRDTTSAPAVVEYPFSVSIYKKGDPDDGAML